MTSIASNQFECFNSLYSPHSLGSKVELYEYSKPRSCPYFLPEKKYRILSGMCLYWRTVYSFSLSEFRWLLKGVLMKSNRNQMAFILGCESNLWLPNLWLNKLSLGACKTGVVDCIFSFKNMWCQPTSEKHCFVVSICRKSTYFIVWTSNIFFASCIPFCLFVSETSVSAVIQ